MESVVFVFLMNNNTSSSLPRTPPDAITSQSSSSSLSHKSPLKYVYLELRILFHFKNE